MASSPSDPPADHLADHLAAHLADHLAGVARSLSTVINVGVPGRLLTVSRTFAARPDAVFDALVTPARVALWLAPLSGELEVGGGFTLDGVASGEVLDCDRPDRFALTWEHDGETTRVDVSLRPTAEGTLLQLDHTVPVDDEADADLGPAATGIGWEVAMVGLAAHLARPGATHLDLLAEPGGFYRTVGEAWAAAAVLAGDDPDPARAAAEQAIAAHAG